MTPQPLRVVGLEHREILVSMPPSNVVYTCLEINNVLTDIYAEPRLGSPGVILFRGHWELEWFDLSVAG